LRQLIIRNDDIDYLIEAVDRAGVVILDHYGHHSVESTKFKQDHSPLTAADLASNDILLRALSLRWPNVPILSEESQNTFGADESPMHYWAVDPLDGTKEFIKKNNEFTVNVALISHGQPVLGVVAAPALDILYVGVVGDGARKRYKGEWEVLPSHSGLFDYKNYQQHIKVAGSRSHPSPALTDWLSLFQSHEFLEMGSSLKFCLVAEGKVNCYPRLGPTCLWDVAAGEAILNAVGGRVLSWHDHHQPGINYMYPKNVLNDYFLAV
jgi:3'(2'), 5'-bisphosphate nucleotidase